jgi:quinoprotein glucose dehydrogenase
MPFGAPTWDRYGGDRKGANHFGTSVVAVDAMTGKRLWHFQVVHHDIWDSDTQAPPALVDVVHGRKTIPAVVIVSKAGLMFVLDRVTGKPIYPVQERPVPKSDVPGEEASPTQPFPVAPEPLARIDLTRADLATVTPELQAYCAKLVADNNIDIGGPYLPPHLNRVTVNWPGTQGGANWGGGSFDPRTGLFFVNVLNFGQMQSLIPSQKGGLPYQMGQPAGRFWKADDRLPCQQPPWGELVAVNVNTAKVLWRSTLGISENLPEGKQATGRPSMGGPIVTAGGLIFIGAADDSRFRAFDEKTGKEVWTYKLGASAHATPMTYRGADGRQYVVIASTGGSFLDTPLTDDSITAFALPSR